MGLTLSEARRTSARWSALSARDRLQHAAKKPGRGRKPEEEQQTWRPTTVSPGLQYQRPLKRTVPSCSRRMRSMRTRDSCEAMNCVRGSRGAWREAAGRPATQSAQCHSPCSRIAS